MARLSVTVRTLILGAALAAMPLAWAEAAGLKIGGVFPLTGQLADYGPTSRNGAALAVKEINAAGGVLGGKVSLIVSDDQTSPQAGVDAAKKLVAVERVNALIGPMGSGVFIPVATAVAVPAGIPVITGSATSPVISTLDAKGYVFRTVPSDAFQGVALADVTKVKGYDSVGVIYVNNDYGKGLAEAFTKAFTKAGGKVKSQVGFETGQVSFRGDVQKVASGHPDALVVIAYTGDGVPILKQALESGAFNQFVLSDGMKAPEPIKELGAQFLNGTAGTAAAPLPGYEAAKTFKAAYLAEYKQETPKPYIDSYYDAVMVLGLAAEVAKSDSGEALRDAIRKLHEPGGEKVGPGDFAKAKALIAKGKPIFYVGASGPLDFDAHGDISGSFEHWEIQDGAIATKRIFVPKP